jgi:pyridoxal phosphate enzyme (YggS family)
MPSTNTKLADIRARMEAAARASDRSPADISLIAVTKTVEPAHIAELIALGQKQFGENRVQEAQLKWPSLNAQTPDLELHLIGPLQTNKLREAIALFDVIQTLDRDKLALALLKERDAGVRLPRLFVQVNIGEETQKAGIMPAEADAFLRRCRMDWALEIEGLMCIPPADAAPQPYFMHLGRIAERNGLGELSMGMSGDFELAIAAGATHVRVGSALFGART